MTAENRLGPPAVLPVVRLDLDLTGASVRPGRVPGRVPGPTGGVAGLEHAKSLPHPEKSIDSGDDSRKFEVLFSSSREVARLLAPLPQRETQPLVDH